MSEPVAKVCVTCRRPILPGEDWSWLDGRRQQQEHDRCYAERFTVQFPQAKKRGAPDPDPVD